MKMQPRSRTLCYFAIPTLMLVACVLRPLPAHAQMTSVGIDCSQIHALGIDKQENLRAGLVLIECGIAQGGQPSDTTSGKPTPPNIRVSNRSCSSDSTCTKSESMVWGSTKNKGNTIVVNYNDHNPSYNTYTGTSYSTDGARPSRRFNLRPL